MKKKKQNQNNKITINSNGNVNINGTVTTTTSNGSITISNNGWYTNPAMPYPYTVHYPQYSISAPPVTYKSLWINFLVKLRDEELRKIHDYYNKIIGSGSDNVYYWH